MVSKGFDRDLYNKYDARARSWFRKILPDGFTTKSNPKKMGIDMLVYEEDEITFYAELETKTGWKSKKFPFESLHLPLRKRKFCSLKYPSIFVVFNATGKAYACVWAHFVLRSPQRIISNKYIRHGEKFFDVPLKWVDFSMDDALRRKWRDRGSTL